MMKHDSRTNPNSSIDHQRPLTENHRPMLSDQPPLTTDHRPLTTAKIGILISGRGSNMMALLDAIGDGRLDAEVAVVISNIETAAGLQKARERGVETLFINHKGRSREAHDADTVAALSARILDEEPRAYPEAVARVLSKGFRVEGQRTFFS